MQNIKIEKIKLKDALASGLSVFNPKIKQRVKIEFDGLSEEETLCYVMCEIVGWTWEKLSTHAFMSAPTIKRRVQMAVKKRNNI